MHKLPMMCLMCSCLFADLLLLKDEENLNCFTSTRFDFTCFFETSDNRTYDLFYNINGCVQRVCIQSFVYEPSWTSDYFSVSSVSPQDQKVCTVCTEDRGRNFAPHLLISWGGHSLVCGNRPRGCGARHPQAPVPTDRLCRRSLWEMLFLDLKYSTKPEHTWSSLSGVDRKMCVLWVFSCPLICLFCL